MLIYSENGGTEATVQWYWRSIAPQSEQFVLGYTYGTESDQSFSLHCEKRVELLMKLSTHTLPHTNGRHSTHFFAPQGLGFESRVVPRAFAQQRKNVIGWEPSNDAQTGNNDDVCHQRGRSD